ncbi:MAG: hypothetical protein FJX59_18265 [Alphaproteobacteria bacterium]|nr:hypothetical protein [Alphaproteobacteria bacterium]
MYLLKKVSSVISRACAAVLALTVLVAPTVGYAQIEQVLDSIRGEGAARVIVKLKTGGLGPSWERAATAAEQRAVVDRAVRTLEAEMAGSGMAVETRFTTLPFVGMTVDERQALDLLTADGVAGVFLNRIERKAQALTARETRALTSSLPTIDLAEAWAAGYEGKDLTIAVIDGGFRTTHPMLKDKAVGDACFSDQDPASKTATQCPSGRTPEIGPGAASNCSALSDRCDHGTHVASIAVGNDGVANYGVARGAKFMPIDVFSQVSDADDCSPDPAPCQLTDSLSVLKALDYVNEKAAEFKIAVVNLSIGGGAHSGACDTDPRREVIEMLRKKGIAVVASAGNEALTGRINAPACITQAIAVGATNDGTTVAAFSNFASHVDLMAPGVSIRAASGRNDGLITLQGTSMSAPHVAGAIAVVKSASPGSSIDEIERALKVTGVKTTRGDSGIIVPKIQVNRSILRLQGRDRREFANVLSATAGSNTASESFLRFNNASNQAGTVTLSLRDSESGRSVGNWTSPTVPGNGTIQVGLGALEKELRAAGSNTPVATAARGFVNLQIASTFPGYMQHVVWAKGIGVLANLSSCNDGFAKDNASLMYVHTSTLAEYPSRIRIANSGGVADSAQLNFYNVANGRLIGTLNTPSIPAGGSIEMTVQILESMLPELAAVVEGGATHVNIRLDGFTGYLQHVVQNSRAGALLDMTPKCALGPGE